ncbi:helix-turn-helix transcriptional regulator [Clostridium sp. E02]|uniref:helix-turn-helix transcriptional regulator n=1 Tax=Clostridium sp. E02 TaxID=2487134 RepID=UPI000F53B157|nr:helix-turn-helix transcriptional regulator [Clostridium sp. E02]
MRTINFIYDMGLIIVFVCACTVNAASYIKTKQIRELRISMLMFFYCVNSLLIVMSEFLSELPFFEGAYNVLTYFGIKVICGIAISTLYLCLTTELLEKKFGGMHVAALLPLICVTVYVGDLNASVMQHWFFYTVRQIYLAGFALYYFVSYKVSREAEYKMRIKKYRLVFIIAGIFAVLIFVEDTFVIFHFQYVINTLGMKLFMEHNFSEDIFFVIIAVYAVRYGLLRLINKKESLSKKRVAAMPEDRFVGAYGLSSRQCDVLFLLLKDKTYQEMGDLLGLSVGTVKFHAHGIYEKTESKNRSELIQKYREFHSSEKEFSL